MLARPHHPHPHPSRVGTCGDGRPRARPAERSSAIAAVDSKSRCAIPPCSDQILQRRPQFAETERIPAAPEFARINPLAGQQ
jgi:hypothetical protein